MVTSSLIPQLEPFWLPGDSAGCLWVAAFTRTPEEMHPCGECLHKRGCRRLGVWLPGRSIVADDQVHLRRQDWSISLKEGILRLRDLCRQAMMIGCAMGRSLSLLPAAVFGEDQLEAFHRVAVVVTPGEAAA